MRRRCWSPRRRRAASSQSLLKPKEKKSSPRRTKSYFRTPCCSFERVFCFPVKAIVDLTAKTSITLDKNRFLKLLAQGSVNGSDSWHQWHNLFSSRFFLVFQQYVLNQPTSSVFCWLYGKGFIVTRRILWSCKCWYVIEKKCFCAFAKECKTA